MLVDDCRPQLSRFRVADGRGASLWLGRELVVALYARGRRRRRVEELRRRGDFGMRA